MPGEAAAAVGSPTKDAFLKEQTDEARAALLKGVDDLRAALVGKLDPRNLPRRLPFVTVGAAAVAGFVAAVATIPSKEQQELRRLARIRRAMYPDHEPAKAERPAKAADGKKAEAAQPLWVTLVREGVQAARPILVSLVTASIKAKQDKPDDTQPPAA